MNMVRILLHKKFIKQYKKLSVNEKNSFKERRNLFLIDPFDPVLNNHKLHGKYKNQRSININSDLRVLYQQDGEHIVFITIDTHSNLYS
ncbi:MAG: type II toxin-antitoxin system mRNA interferase toxin, RelE/StbE family [Patescibacteria group bacterium]